MSQSWNPSYLFIATLEGFYFDEINKIMEKSGKISGLEQLRQTAEKIRQNQLKKPENCVNKCNKCNTIKKGE